MAGAQLSDGAVASVGDGDKSCSNLSVTRTKARQLAADTFSKIVVFHRGFTPDEGDGGFGEGKPSAGVVEGLDLFRGGVSLWRPDAVRR